MQKSLFDLSHGKKLSMDMGKLVPIFMEEVVPGDTFKVSSELLIRIAPLLAPTMHQISAFTHFFFVPSRLLQTNWEKFITHGEDGDDSTAIPTVVSPASTGYAIGTLWDYFGLPTGVPDLSVVAYPFRAMGLIYNEWYRDETLQDKVVVSLADGVDSTTSMALLSRNWEKDYFTSALPSPQRGSAISIPLGTEAPVLGIGMTNTTYATGPQQAYESDDGLGTYANYKVNGVNEANSNLMIEEGTTGYPNIRADLSTAAAVTINALRSAIQLQKWAETNARGGVRYVESNFAHFGVRSSDARLQRPEFLGGGRSPIIVSEVIQTSETSATSPQGNLSGHGFSAQRSHTFQKSFEEHGYIIGILSVMPRTGYFQGIPRQWTRTSYLDFYWPLFANLGEQAVLNKELYAAHATPEGIFGYTPRYNEMRIRESSVAGDFRDEFKYWHMDREFSSDPSLNSAFVTSDPTKRINAVTDEHNLWVQIEHKVKALRPIPKQGIPGRMDH